MSVEIYEPRKHQASFGIDRRLRLYGFPVPGLTNNFVSTNKDFARAIDASFRVDDCSASDSQINFHVSTPYELKLHSFEKGKSHEDITARMPLLSGVR
jgi:hypothetical protein